MYGLEPINRDETFADLPNPNPMYKIVGWIHTHPNPGRPELYNPELFSWADLIFSTSPSNPDMSPADLALWPDHPVTGYLVAPSGRILRLGPFPEAEVTQQIVAQHWGQPIPDYSPLVSVVFRDIFSGR